MLRIKQKEDESVDDFFVRMETQIRDTVIPENILVGMVIQALKGRIGEKVFSRSPQPTTLEEVRTAARQAEQTGKLYADENNATIRLELDIQDLKEKLHTTLAAINSTDTGQHHERNWYGNREREFNNHRQQRRNRTDEDTECGNCGTLCKRSSKCPASDKICFQCNRKGHFKRRCGINYRNRDTYQTTSHNIQRNGQQNRH